jgi:hypothetical protein
MPASAEAGGAAKASMPMATVAAISGVNNDFMTKTRKEMREAAASATP